MYLFSVDPMDGSKESKETFPDFFMKIGLRCLAAGRYAFKNL